MSQNQKSNNKAQDKTQDVEKVEKMHELQREEEELKAQASGMYGLDIIEIEKLMGFYKERGTNFQDLETIKALGGPEGIMLKLKTDPKNGISSLENRENDFGSNKVFIEPVPPFCSYVCEALEDLLV